MQQTLVPQDLEPWAEPVAADRLLLFSDAVFAISATLLALDIRVPAGLSSAQFLPALRDQLPAIAAYAFSFGVIGQLWLFHHRSSASSPGWTPPSWSGAWSCWPWSHSCRSRCGC
jgi:hypothetical protein